MKEVQSGSEEPVAPTQPEGNSGSGLSPEKLESSVVLVVTEIGTKYGAGVLASCFIEVLLAVLAADNRTGTVPAARQSDPRQDPLGVVKPAEPPTHCGHPLKLASTSRSVGPLGACAGPSSPADQSARVAEG